MKIGTRKSQIFFFRAMGCFAILGSSAFVLACVLTKPNPSAIEPEASGFQSIEAPEIPSFEKLYATRLQGPLVDPPAVEETRPIGKPRQIVRLPASIKLKNILFDAESSLAVFYVGNDKVTCGIGESVENAQVKIIEQTGVTLVYQDQEFKLKLK